MAKRDVTHRSVTKIRHAERVDQALVLRRKRMTFEAIGKELGVSKQHAQRLVEEGLDLVRDEIYGDAERLMAAELDALDGLYNALLPKAMEGHIDAVTECRAIRAQVQKLLGLVRPSEVNVRGYHVVTTREQALADGKARRVQLLTEAG